MKLDMSRHAEQERCQQRAVPRFVFELTPYAESVRARGHAEMLFFTRKSFQRMRQAGVCPVQIKILQKKQNLRLMVSDNEVITVMYAYRSKKRIRNYDH